MIYLLSKDQTPYTGVCNLPQITTTYYDCDIDLTQFDLTLLTSKESVNALIHNGIEIAGHDVLCVSAPTAAYAQKMGMHPLQSAHGYGKELFEIVKKNYKDKKIFFPHAKVLAFDMMWHLQKHGIDCTELCVYETLCSNKEDVAFEQEDIFIFTAPSTVACFAQNYGFFSGLKAVVIGKTTKEALPQGVEIHMAQETSIASCVAKARSL